MGDIKLGDEVRVFDVNGRRNGQPEGGWPGEVVRVGRTLVDIQYRSRIDSFRIDSGRVNDKYGHQWFKTLEQAAAAERLNGAHQILREHKVSLERGNTFTADQVERLAALVRSFDKEA